MFCMYMCMKVDAVYNLILFQLRYIIFSSILHANVRQQLCVVRMYVGCSKTHKFYFLFYVELLAARLCVQRQMYFMCPPSLKKKMQCNLPYLCMLL